MLINKSIKQAVTQLSQLLSVGLMAPCLYPMAEKLLLIKSLGYLPNDIRWSGFRVCEQRAIIITPSGREFSPKELESFVFWRDEHRQLVEKFGHIDQSKVYPAKENVLPFRGGHRMKAADWIPSKNKLIK